MIDSPLSVDAARAVEILLAGGLVAFPTETVYGLGADARVSSAVRRIYVTKGRPPSNPLIVHVDSFSAILHYADIWRSFDPSLVTERLERLKALWPGPLSVILPRGSELAPEVSAGGDSVAFRIPSLPLANELLTRFGGPVAAPSANRSEYVSPTCADHVLRDLGPNLIAGQDGIVDGGGCPVGIESTVLSLLTPTPLLLRPGSITREQLENLLGCAIAVTHHRESSAEAPLLSPGLLAKHYAPHTPVRFLNDAGKESSLPPRVGVILFSERPLDVSPQVQIILSAHNNLNAVATGLFAALRELDAQGLDLILVDTCEPQGIGAAIMDRLSRASTAGAE